MTAIEQAARLEILLTQLNAILRADTSDDIKIEIIREYVARATKQHLTAA